MKTTEKFDKNGLEIFVGDKIIHAWGWFRYGGKMRTRLEIHSIIERDAHRMADGQMHDDGGGKIFCMGRTTNFWKGEEVQKLTEEEVKEIGVEEDTSFFFDDNDKAVLFTDQHFMGLNDEDWAKELERRKEHLRKVLFGIK